MITIIYLLIFMALNIAFIIAAGIIGRRYTKQNRERKNGNKKKH